MKKVIFALCVLLALVGCKKNENSGGDTSSFAFNNGKDGELSMTINTMVTVSFTNGVTPSKVNITSTDEDVVYFSELDGALVAKSNGTAIVTATLKENPEVYATLTVTVTSYLNNVKFYSVMFWGGDDEWDEKEYVIYRIRRYVGDDLALNTDHKGDTADIQSWMDEVQPGTWYYLYTNESGDSVGLFGDSILAIKTQMLSTDLTYSDGLVLSGDAGLSMVYENHIMYDTEGFYCLGSTELVEDVCAVGKQFTKTGAEKVPYPGCIQVGHFNAKHYVSYFGAALDGEDPDPEDYPYFDLHDTYLLKFFMYEVEDGSKTLGALKTGYPILPEEENDYDFFLWSTEMTTKTMYMAYYNFDAMLLPQVEYNYGLKTELAEDGKEYFVQPYELDNITEFHYEAGSIPEEAQGARRQNAKDSHIAVPRAGFEKRMSFDRTVAATLRSIMAKRMK